MQTPFRNANHTEQGPSGHLTLSQETYRVEGGELLKDFGLQEAKAVTTPMEAGEDTEPWKLVQGDETYTYEEAATSDDSKRALETSKAQSVSEYVFILIVLNQDKYVKI